MREKDCKSIHAPIQGQSVTFQFTLDAQVSSNVSTYVHHKDCLLIPSDCCTSVSQCVPHREPGRESLIHTCSIIQGRRTPILMYILQIFLHAEFVVSVRTRHNKDKCKRVEGINGKWLANLDDST